MQIKFLVVIVCLCGIVWFAIENKEVTSSVKFFFGEPILLPTIVVIAISALMGVISTLTFGIIDQFRLRKVLKEKERELRDLRERCSKIEDLSKGEEEKKDEFSQ